VIFNDGWMEKIFDIAEVKKSVERICEASA
jgi:hypothetical protein